VRIIQEVLEVSTYNRKSLRAQKKKKKKKKKKNSIHLNVALEKL
jgi:hypothetical protein